MLGTSEGNASVLVVTVSAPCPYELDPQCSSSVRRRGGIMVGVVATAGQPLAFHHGRMQCEGLYVYVCILCMGMCVCGFTVCMSYVCVYICLYVVCVCMCCGLGGGTETLTYRGSSFGRQGPLASPVRSRELEAHPLAPHWLFVSCLGYCWALPGVSWVPLVEC